jgi:hypothetical protein
MHSALSNTQHHRRISTKQKARKNALAITAPLEYTHIAEQEPSQILESRVKHKYSRHYSQCLECTVRHPLERLSTNIYTSINLLASQAFFASSSSVSKSPLVKHIPRNTPFSWFMSSQGSAYS